MTVSDNKDLSKAIKRLELIKSHIALEEEEEILTQVSNPIGAGLRPIAYFY